MSGRIVACFAVVTLAAVAFGQVAANPGIGRIRPIRPIGIAAPGGGLMEVAGHNADVVVTGKVIEVFKPEQTEIKLPGQDKAAKGTFAKYKIEVDKVLKKPVAAKDAKEDKQPEFPKTIEIVTQSMQMEAMPMPMPMPAPQLLPGGNGGAMLMQQIAPGDVVVGRPIAIAPGYIGGVTLEKDQSYILFVQKLPDRNDYFADSQDKVLPADKETVAKAEKALAMDKWAWGKEVSGLQMALVCPDQMQSFAMANKDGGRGSLMVAFAIRNVSKEDIVLNTDPADKTLNLQVKAGDKDTSVNLYQYAGKETTSYPIVEIKPGQTVFVQVVPGAGAVCRATVMAGEGKIGVTAGYSNEKDATGDRARKLWKGKLTSEPVSVEVKQTKAQVRPLPMPVQRMPVEKMPAEIEVIQPDQAN